MVQVGDYGIRATTLAEYIELLQARYRAALGQDTSFEAATIQMQLIGVQSRSMEEIDQQIVALGAVFGLSTAAGTHLDALLSTLGIERIAATRTTATVTLSGTDGTVIPAASVVSTPAGDLFELPADATIGTGGTVDASMQSVEFGPVAAAAGSISQIVTPIAGWSGATNAAAATPGRLTETDDELRIRARRLIGRNAQGSLDAISAAVYNVPNVTHVRVVENRLTVATELEGVPVAANAYLAIVAGGTDQQVAEAIAGAAPAGIPGGVRSTTLDGALTDTATSVTVADASQIATGDYLLIGAELVSVTGKSGNVLTVTRDPDAPQAAADGARVLYGRFAPASADVSGVPVDFARVAQVPLTVSVTLTARPDFPSRGVADIQDAIVRYVEGLAVGRGLEADELLGPIYTVPGHTADSSSLVVARSSGAGGVASSDLALHELLTVRRQDITLSVM